MQKLLALSISLCAAACTTATYGGNAPPGHPPPLPPGVTVEKWDHFCAIVRDSEGPTRLLDEASEAGWQMVSYAFTSSSNLVCFKRPRVTAPPPAPPAAPPNR